MFLLITNIVNNANPVTLLKMGKYQTLSTFYFGFKNLFFFG